MPQNCTKVRILFLRDGGEGIVLGSTEKLANVAERERLRPEISLGL